MPGASTAGSTLSGAASGAAAGTAVLPGIGTLVGAGVGALGGYLTGKGTQAAQNAANAAQAQAAATQNAQAFANYLSSRGISLQQIIAANPRFEQEYNRVRAAGDKRSIDVWLFDHLKANPSDPAWQQINTGSAGAQNTTLPAWAVDANGNPLQPSILRSLVGISSGANNPATAPIAGLATVENAHALLAARPDLAQQLADAGVGSDGRSPEQWLVDHITQTEGASGGGTFTTALREFLAAPSSASGGGGPAAGSAGTGNNTTLDPAIAALIPNAAKTVGGIFDGTLLGQVNEALQPIAQARSAEAAAQMAKVNELRGLSGTLLNTQLGGNQDVLNTRQGGIEDIFGASTSAANQVNEANITKLADLLGVRRDAAAQIYNASLGAAGGLRDARTTGAKGIYDSELLRADTYGQSARDALSRLLAEQGAERARRGFTGGSSGSDITRARLMADYTQRGAGARADAGVNYQGRLSDAGIGYAGDVGRADVGRATTIGAANEQDAIGKLNAAVQLAHDLGLAGINRSTSLAGAANDSAVADLQAKVADATRRLGYLTSDADIAKAHADLQNAQDQLNAIIANQNRMTGSLSAPFQLAGADLSLKSALTDAQYGGLDALLKRLSSFTVAPAGGPGVSTPLPGSVLNNTQIAGGALSGLGSVIGNTSNNAALDNLIKLLSASSTPAPSPTPAPGPTPLLGIDPYAQPAPKV